MFFALFDAKRAHQPLFSKLRTDTQNQLHAKLRAFSFKFAPVTGTQ